MGLSNAKLNLLRTEYGVRYGERVTECKSLEDARTLASETGGKVVYRPVYVSEWMKPKRSTIVVEITDETISALCKELERPGGT